MKDYLGIWSVPYSVATSLCGARVNVGARPSLEAVVTTCQYLQLGLIGCSCIKLAFKLRAERELAVKAGVWPAKEDHCSGPPDFIPTQRSKP